MVDIYADTVYRYTRCGCIVGSCDCGYVEPEEEEEAPCLDRPYPKYSMSVKIRRRIIDLRGLIRQRAYRHS